jgi:hypothetical protein
VRYKQRCQRAVLVFILILVEAHLCLCSTILLLEDYLRTSAHMFDMYGMLHSGLLDFEHTLSMPISSLGIVGQQYGGKEGDGGKEGVATPHASGA